MTDTSMKRSTVDGYRHQFRGEIHRVHAQSGSLVKCACEREESAEQKRDHVGGFGVGELLKKHKASTAHEFVSTNCPIAAARALQGCYSCQHKDWATGEFPPG